MISISYNSFSGHSEFEGIKRQNVNVNTLACNIIPKLLGASEDLHLKKGNNTDYFDRISPAFKTKLSNPSREVIANRKIGNEYNNFISAVTDLSSGISNNGDCGINTGLLEFIASIANISQTPSFETYSIYSENGSSINFSKDSSEIEFTRCIDIDDAHSITIPLISAPPILKGLIARYSKYLDQVKKDSGHEKILVAELKDKLLTLKPSFNSSLEMMQTGALRA